MKKCPNCENDYIDEAVECSSCKIPLVIKPSYDEHVDLDNLVFLKGSEKLLVKVETEDEADAIKGYLKLHDIDVLFKYAGIGGYLKIYMGTPHNSMIEIYVLDEFYEKANKLLLATVSPEDEIDEIFYEDDNQKKSYKNLDRYETFRKVAKWLMLTSFFVPLTIMILFQLSTIFN
jgi:hypothetical protein